MLVDDHVDTAELLAELLEQTGHRVSVHFAAASALAAVAAFQPEILLVDLDLPGMNGVDLVRTLRGLPECITSRIVVVSGFVRPADRTRALEAGADFYLAKPVSFPILRDLLETI